MDLNNFARGNLVKQISEGIREILKNIADESTPARAKRQLVIKIVFRPGRDRKNLKIGIETKINTAPVRSTETNMFIGCDLEGNPVFYDTDEQIPGQLCVGTGKVVE